MNNCQDLVESFSGVRGKFGKSITPDFAFLYAFAFSRWIVSKTKGRISLMIGMDTRSSSRVLKKSMIRAFIKAGVGKIYDAGIMPTQAVELGVREYRASGGIMITASHNEPEWNGWKLLDKDGAVLGSREMEEIIRLRKSLKIQNFSKKCQIVKKQEDLKKRYIKFVLSLLGQKGIKEIQKRKFRILIDPNGGAASVILPELLKKLKVDFIPVNMKLGHFKRLIEPKAESLKYLVPKIKATNCDFGAAWDCDGDRMEMVLSSTSQFAQKRGNIISGQYVFGLLVLEVLSNLKNPKGSWIVVNDATSQLIEKVAEKFGARIKEVEVGEINVVDKMYQLKSPVGGEGSSSGGIFPPSRCRDGILTLVMLLKLMAEKKKNISDLLVLLPQYFTPAIKVKCKPENQKRLKLKLIKYFKKLKYPTKKTGGLTGGLKIYIDKNSWLWYRASKTEAGIFRIIADARTEKKAYKIISFGKKIFRKLEK